MEEQKNKDNLSTGSRPGGKKPWFYLIKKGFGYVGRGIKNHVKKRIFGVKRRPVVFLIIGLVLTAIMIFGIWVYSLDYSKGQTMEFNISYSGMYAKELGLDWKAVYLAILDDLKPEKVRIPVYWNLLEPVKDRFMWDGVDWQIAEAQKRGVEVVLVIGRRVPRWPECHEPLWLLGKGESEKQPEILKLVKKEVEHFKKFDNIVMWQVENEALFNLFGECPKISKEFLKKGLVPDQGPVIDERIIRCKNRVGGEHLGGIRKIENLHHHEEQCDRD